MSGVDIKLDNRLCITGELLDSVFWEIKNRFTFENPAYLDAERRGYSTWNKPRYITGYEMAGDSIILPRGVTRQVLGIMKKEGLAYRIDDFRRILPPVELVFRGELRGFQQAALDAVLARQFGTLSAPTGSGKTVIALAVIAARKQPTLVVVHTKELVNQWLDRIETFLGIPRREIGIIGGGEKRLGKELTVGIVNSIYPTAHEINEYIGHIVVDECHHIPSRTFTQAVSAFDSKFMLGLSATPWRRDKLTRLIYWHLGDRVHEIGQGALQESGDVLRAEVIVRETDYISTWDASVHYARMLSELTRDYERNRQIVGDVIEEARQGQGICLVLTDRKAHCEELAAILDEHGIHVEVLTADLARKKREDVVERVNAGAVPVLVATGQLIGEGFDCRELSTLFLATPIKFNGRLVQYLGRVLRPAPGKEKARVYDYVDSNIGVLVNSARVRQQVYGG